VKDTTTRAGELLGERLRVLRQKKHVTQVTLAERAGLPQSHISEIERGVMLPNLVTLLRLAAALPCKVSEFTSVFDKEDIASLIPK
jgi:transcriptional regulator with XRE-family HTH domain